MPNRMKILRSTTASVTPPNGVAADYGRLASNLTDRKVWMYGATGTPVLIASYTSVHNPASGYVVGDLVVQSNILYRCLANIGPKAFAPGDWQSVSDFRDILLYRDPTTQAQATVNIGAAGISFRLNANAGQTAAIQQWRNAAGVTVADIRSDGYPGEAFGRPVFRVDQVAHSFTAIGQPARFDGTNWVLASAATEPGFVIGIVRRILSANAFEIQTTGRIDDMQNAAFESGSYVANTRYYVSTTTPGTLTDVAPPDAEDANVALHTLSAGAAIINIAIPLGAGGGGGAGSDILVTQVNSFTDVGQVAAFNGSWVLASGVSATAAPLGLIVAVAGNDFVVRTTGLLEGITAGAADVFPLTPGAPYYATAGGLLTATAPTGTPVAAAPVLWAVSGTSGVVVAQPQSANILRPSQNLGDLLSVPTAITNLGLDNVVRNTRRVDTGTGLTGGGDLTANRTIALSAGSIASLALADSSVQPTRLVNSGTGLTGGGDLSANRTLSLTGQALALHNLTGAGIVTRTGTDTFVVRSIAGGDGITVTNGAGTSANPSIAVNGTVMRGANNLSDLASAPASIVALGITSTAAELNILDGATLTTTELNRVAGVTSPIQTQLNAKAPLSSPSLTGVPTAPTAAPGTSTLQIATTEFVQDAVSPIARTTVELTVSGNYEKDLTLPGDTPITIEMWGAGASGATENDGTGSSSGGGGGAWYRFHTQLKYLSAVEPFVIGTGGAPAGGDSIGNSGGFTEIFGIRAGGGVRGVRSGGGDTDGGAGGTPTVLNSNILLIGTSFSENGGTGGSNSGGGSTQTPGGSTTIAGPGGGAQKEAGANVASSGGAREYIYGPGGDGSLSDTAGSGAFPGGGGGAGNVAPSGAGADGLIRITVG